jgi:hypothetical protein
MSSSGHKRKLPEPEEPVLKTVDDIIGKSVQVLPVIETTRQLNIAIFYDSTDDTFLRTATMASSLYASSPILKQVNTFPASVEALREAIGAIEASRVDQVVLHYIGHGVNSGLKYPVGVMKALSLDLIDIATRLTCPNSLVIMDCCNGYPSDPSYLQLFNNTGINTILNLRGRNWTSSSKPGSLSYYIPQAHTLFQLALERACHNARDGLTGFMTLLNLYMRREMIKNEIPVDDTGVMIAYEFDPANGYEESDFLKTVTKKVSVSRVQAMQPFSAKKMHSIFTPAHRSLDFGPLPASTQEPFTELSSGLSSSPAPPSSDAKS